MRLLLLLALFLSTSVCSAQNVGEYESPENFTLPVLMWLTTAGAPFALGAGFDLAFNLGVEDYFLDNPDALPNTELIIDITDEAFSASVAVERVIDVSLGGGSFLPGNFASDVVVVSGQAATVYKVAQISPTANTQLLSNKVVYPYFSRNYIPTTGFIGAIVASLEYFVKEGGIGYDKIAVVSTSDSFGQTAARALITQLEKTTSIQVLTYQSFLTGALDVTVETNEIKNSGARVIVTFCIDSISFNSVLLEGEREGIVGENYVWYASSSTTGAANYVFANGTRNEPVISAMRGLLGVEAFIPRVGRLYDRLLAEWIQADPVAVRGAGPGTVPTFFAALTYDMGYISAHVVSEVDKQGQLRNIPKNPVPVDLWVNLTREYEFFGASGFSVLEENGDRLMTVALVYFVPENLTYVQFATWNTTAGLSDVGRIVWYDNTTRLPDLDIRPPYRYWSCWDKEEGYDPTGKTIILKRPDGDDVDYIEHHYHCDNFIDCHNFSDESYNGCSSNYLALFIAFGIITGILIIIAILFIPFVIIFGFCVPRTRIRAASPLFMLFMIFFGIVGYCSTFAWYGKPHPVACGFQPWLLGLSVVAMISALCAKTFRIWRIFKSPWNKTVITDLELVFLWIVMVIPALIILVIWTIVSTPTAQMENIDGDDHYICATGGFTGYPGGLVFFFILVGYESVVLLIGAFLSIATRNVTALFNESKLLAISIYNLAFLAIIVIPTVIVLNEFNPFISWIIRTIAILYAFTATLWLQFLPKIYYVVIVDRLKDKQLKAPGRSDLGTSGTQSSNTQR